MLFRSLATFAQSSRSLPINYYAKRERESAMWNEFSKVIEPYATSELASGRVDIAAGEKLALMLAEWCRLADPLMNSIRPIVVAMVERDCYNLKILSTLIGGFNELDMEMAESKIFMCTLLTERVQGVCLLKVITGIQTIIFSNYWAPFKRCLRN
jgi:hypothetical protein